MSLPDKYRHRHLFFFHKVWDLDHDGSLTAEDFDSIAESLAVIQRHGQWEEDVIRRWKSYLHGWFDILMSETSTYNKQPNTEATFEEWFRFLHRVSLLSDRYEELPDFLRAYANLLFVRMDNNKDGLICVKDYRMYLAKTNMDIMRANDCYAYMLNSDDMRNHDAVLSRARFDELFYEYWTSHDDHAKGQYIAGPYDSIPCDELELLNRPRRRQA